MANFPGIDIAFPDAELNGWFSRILLVFIGSSALSDWVLCFSFSAMRVVSVAVNTSTSEPPPGVVIMLQGSRCHVGLSGDDASTGLSSHIFHLRVSSL